MTDTTAIHEGGCLCGAVRWRAVGPFRDFTACHCTQCRRTSGHFVAMSSVPLDSFTITREDGLAWFQSSSIATRGFCRICGGNLFWKPTAEARISIAGGSFDGPTGLSIAKNIYCADKGDYYEIPPGAPCHPESD
ncbi:GFA family protein [Prosthecomicrobium sp. N25]|uniref:GFA family protein n=1 Tax=Prosthecomicrobium sp. N25 TaxID=3129254 RepID=UPI003077EED9